MGNLTTSHSTTARPLPYLPRPSAPPAPAVPRPFTPHAPFSPPPPLPRLSAPVAPPSSSNVHLPKICRRHGCTGAACQRLHLCCRFLADICNYDSNCRHGHSLTTVHNQIVCNKYGLGTGSDICNYDSNCRHGHSLTTVHNQIVCNKYGLGTGSELLTIQKLRRAFEENGEMSEATYHRNLEMCFKFGTPNSCNEQLCNRVHICRKFIAGNCTRRVCKFGHDLHTTHNNGVLSRHKVTRMTDAAIMDLLRGKDPASSTQQGAGGAAAARAGRGREAPRRQQRGDGGDGHQNVGLSEELMCPVCLEMFDRATTLGCGHTFCSGCLDQVREVNNACPTCRTHITTATRSVALDNIINNMAAKR